MLARVRTFANPPQHQKTPSSVLSWTTVRLTSIALLTGALPRPKQRREVWIYKTGSRTVSQHKIFDVKGNGEVVM